MNNCPICNAEMIPGFSPTTFYCPNECDLKKAELLKSVPTVDADVEKALDAGVSSSAKPWCHPGIVYSTFDNMPAFLPSPQMSIFRNTVDLADRSWDAITEVDAEQYMKIGPVRVLVRFVSGDNLTMWIPM